MPAPPASFRTGELSRAGVVAVAFAGFATFLDLYATQPLLPHFRELFHAPVWVVGLTVSAPTAAVALVAPVLGLHGDRLSRTRVMTLSLLALAATSLLAATSRGLPSLIGWRFLQGAATPGIYVMALAYLSEEAGEQTLGRAMAAFVTGNVIGGFAGRALTGYIAARWDWPAAFVVLGLLNLVGAAVIARWLPVSQNFAPQRSASASTLARAKLLATPRLAATFAIGFNVLFSLVALFSYVVYYLSAAPFLLTTERLSAVFTVYLVGAVVTPLVGRMIDGLGARTVLVSALTLGASGALLTLVPSLVAVVAGLALACSAAFVCQAASTTQLRTAAPASLRALASGAYVSCYYLGGSAGGVAPGLVWRRTGWPGCVALIVLVDLLTIVLASIFWREPPANPSPASLLPRPVDAADVPPAM